MTFQNGQQLIPLHILPNISISKGKQIKKAFLEDGSPTLRKRSNINFGNLKTNLVWYF